MIYGCDCGTDYVVIPKEIPVANDEHHVCAGCGSELRGRWSLRNFDYAPLHSSPKEDRDSSFADQIAGRIPSGFKNS
jgi:hypothetical protein